MKITGIICEYNPFHNGHSKQLNMLKGADESIVCLMSGNFVQRGAPAIIDKSLRAQAAILSGADLVLEMPVTVSLRSAEGFAAGCVEILSGFCDTLCFGAETPDAKALTETANALLSDCFRPFLTEALEEGLSFPAARQKALQDMGIDASVLSEPNNILAVEYCKAILQQGSRMKPLPILREGSYHATEPDLENPSATFLRACMQGDKAWQDYVPELVRSIFENARIHTTQAGELAILGRLRTMTDEEFEALPFGSEGLWRKLMHAAKREATLEALIAAVKSKRYTRTRLDRMIMCAFLSITEQLLNTPAPYVRVLGFNDKGRQILKSARGSGNFVNTGQVMEHPYQAFEERCQRLYQLFEQSHSEALTPDSDRRVFYHA